MVTVEWHGIKILNQVREVCTESEEAVAKRIAKIAKKKCPVGDFERAARPGQEFWKTRRPGLLRDSIQYKKSKYRDGGWIVFVPGQGSGTYYVRWVELGAPERSHEQWKTSGHAYPVPRQPFLRPAAEEEKRHFRKRLILAFVGKLH